MRPALVPPQGGQDCVGVSTEGVPVGPPAALLTTLKRHKCLYCTYSTSRKHSLIVHLRTHTGEKPFMCPHCPYRCTKKVNLKIHIRTHTGEKPFVCHHCPFRSAQKVNLVRHMQTHSR
ncbi:hypothetical protein Pcinc_037340 [Petrolisthes cinctipes]|uniref:C2H2-type domain-containing protein n=1 Tax=Petrolisthes cinctipes TaxID=88211 RepID=A0AAE1BWR0_PETCI|nr:hypothetical protein Pcinc_037340 [Petrolisthes cinctipes]